MNSTDLHSFGKIKALKLHSFQMQCCEFTNDIDVFVMMKPEYADNLVLVIYMYQFNDIVYHIMNQGGVNFQSVGYIGLSVPFLYFVQLFSIVQ